METNFLEIETICVTNKEVTIAANILLKGFNYSEPTYTNIFCEEEKLTDSKKQMGEVTIVAKKNSSLDLAAVKSDIKINHKAY